MARILFNTIDWLIYAPNKLHAVVEKFMDM